MEAREEEVPLLIMLLITYTYAREAPARRTLAGRHCEERSGRAETGLHIYARRGKFPNISVILAYILADMPQKV